MNDHVRIFQIFPAQFYKVQFDGGHGLLKNIINMESSVQASIIQNLFWYNASNGNNASAQKSGKFRASKVRTVG